MYLIVINLNSFFKATSITKSSYISILHQFKMGQSKPFTAVLPYMKTDFYKIYKTGCSGKYPNYENSMLHYCCEHCQVKSIVLQTCLQTISSSVLSSDGHLKPTCVCKFNLGSLHVIMKIVITTLIRLQVCANCWYESYLRAFE